MKTVNLCSCDCFGVTRTLAYGSKPIEIIFHAYRLWTRSVCFLSHAFLSVYRSSCCLSIAQTEKTIAAKRHFHPQEHRGLITSSSFSLTVLFPLKCSFYFRTFNSNSRFQYGSQFLCFEFRVFSMNFKMLFHFNFKNHLFALCVVWAHFCDTRFPRSINPRWRLTNRKK